MNRFINTANGMSCHRGNINKVTQMKSYTAYPLLFMTSITWSTYFSHSSVLPASTITRTTGSVPLSRTRIRPSVPSALATASTAALTSASSCACVLSVTLMFLRTCGYITSGAACSDYVFFLASITSFILRAVIIASPVVAYLENIICPDCSPPMR